MPQSVVHNQKYNILPWTSVLSFIDKVIQSSDVLQLFQCCRQMQNSKVIRFNKSPTVSRFSYNANDYAAKLSAKLTSFDRLWHQHLTHLITLTVISLRLSSHFDGWTQVNYWTEHSEILHTQSSTNVAHANTSSHMFLCCSSSLQCTYTVRCFLCPSNEPEYQQVWKICYWPINFVIWVFNRTVTCPWTTTGRKSPATVIIITWGSCVMSVVTDILNFGVSGMTGATVVKLCTHMGHFG